MSAAGKGIIGIVGLGIMGGAIARNLKAAGWRVVGYDIAAARNAELNAAGVEIAASAGELARATPVILTSLPDPRALEATVREIVAAKLDRRVVVEMSTFALDDKEKAERFLRRWIIKGCFMAFRPRYRGPRLSTLTN